MNDEQILQPVDLGHAHRLKFFGWSPDRDLNPQYEGIPDEKISGAIIDHPSKGGDYKGVDEPCAGAITFDTFAMRTLNDRQAPEHQRPLWSVLSLEPLTITPSVLCSCGDHGFITNGQWVPA